MCECGTRKIKQCKQEGARDRTTWLTEARPPRPAQRTNDRSSKVPTAKYVKRNERRGLGTSRESKTESLLTKHLLPCVMSSRVPRKDVKGSCGKRSTDNGCRSQQSRPRQRPSVKIFNSSESRSCLRFASAAVFLHEEKTL